MIKQLNMLQLLHVKECSNLEGLEALAPLHGLRI